MAGQPKKRATVAKLEQVGIETVAEMVALTSIRKAAAQLGVSFFILHQWLTTERNNPIYRKACLVRGAHIAEQALEIADTADAQNAQAAKLQIDTRRWLASVLDRETFGKQSQSVTVNIGELHIDALRSIQTARKGEITLRDGTLPTRETPALPAASLHLDQVATRDLSDSSEELT